MSKLTIITPLMVKASGLRVSNMISEAEVNSSIMEMEGIIFRDCAPSFHADLIDNVDGVYDDILEGGRFDGEVYQGLRTGFAKLTAGKMMIAEVYRTRFGTVEKRSDNSNKANSFNSAEQLTKSGVDIIRRGLELASRKPETDSRVKKLPHYNYLKGLYFTDLKK